jgi:hypothetical protein
MSTYLYVCDLALDAVCGAEQYSTVSWNVVCYY